MRAVSVTVSDSEVAERGGFGLSVGAIDVERADGKTARFWISLYFNPQGRIVAELRANHAESETAKTVRGSWLDYEARRNAL